MLSVITFILLNMKRDQQQMQIVGVDLERDRSQLTQVSIEEPFQDRGKKRGKGKKDRYPELSDSLLGNQEGEKKDKKKKGKEKKKFSWPVWKKLFQYSVKRKFHFILGLTLNILFAVAVSWLPLKVGEILDQITVISTDGSSKNMESLKTQMFQLGLLTFFLAIFTFARFMSLQFLQEFIAIDMRTDFYKKFMENDIHFFELYKSGELVSRLSSDVSKAKSAISNNLTYMIRSLVIIASTFVVLFTINQKLTWLVALIVPFYLLITAVYSSKKKILVRETQDVEAEIAGLVAEKFSGIQLVKAYSNQNEQIKKYVEVIYKGYGINKKKILITGIYNTIGQFLPYVGILLVLWYGGEMVISGSQELTAGQLTSFILYCRALSNSSAAIANCYTNIINGTYAVQKIFEMLDYEPLMDEMSGSSEVISGEIQFDKVTFKYPVSKTIALRDLSFKINDGEYVAFVGESGSGKSTIVKLIEKFYQIESGTIRLGGKDQANIKAGSLRKQMGLVNQQATLFSGTIKSNITYGIGMEVEDEDIQDAAQRAGCDFLNDSKRFPQKFLSEVGEKGSQLSGGQKQRISIARALLRKPKIVIFDEATSALDSNSESLVQQSIESLAGNSQNRPTIIVIAHRLSTVINANRLFVMKNGQIQETGSHYELLEKRGYYYELIEKQLADGIDMSSPPKNSKNEIMRESVTSADSGYLPPGQL